MKKKMLFCGAACAVVSLLSGCATMFSNNTTTATIDADTPANVMVFARNKNKIASGPAPLEVTLTAADSLEKYYARIQEIANPDNIQEFSIAPRINGVVWANLLLIPCPPLCVAGFIIDIASGAGYCFEDDYTYKITQQVNF